MRVTASVTGTSDFGMVRRAVNLQAQASVVAAANAGRAVAIAHARRKTGAMASIIVEPVQRTELGWMCAFRSPVKHAWWQNDGTLGNREKKLRNAPTGDRARGPGTGVKPSHFLYFGLGAGRQQLYAKAGAGRSSLGLRN